jgi:hypothetical protein
MQVEQNDKEIEKSEQIEMEKSDAYSLFVYAVHKLQGIIILDD